MTSLEGVDSHLLDVVHGQVHVFPVMTIVGVTVQLYLVGLIVLAARVVHHHDEGAVELLTYHLFIE